MTTELVTQEINRILASEDAEVLCIRGRWGVGKTYAWQTYLKDARKQGRIAKQNYAYVSLFGLNSLDDLRYAIFESTVPLENLESGPDAETFGQLVDKGLALGRKARSWVAPVLGSIGLGEVGTAVARSAFLLVRKQLICIDDMERAGEGLKPGDILGLTSFLKEQRACRIVILLNDEAMTSDDQEKFNLLLEKVVDVSVTFEPSPAEAAAIALTGTDTVSEQIRDLTTKIGITNIRVIKKIERMARALADTLKSYRPEILAQALRACVIGGWSAFEPQHAPKLDYIVKYNALFNSTPPDQEPDLLAAQWRKTFDRINFVGTDDFDNIIVTGAKQGYFSTELLLEAATNLQNNLISQPQETSYTLAWRQFHQSWWTDDGVLLDSLRDAAYEHLTDLDLRNINPAIAVLREAGREEEANKLAVDFAEAQSPHPKYYRFFDHHFNEQNPMDPGLRSALEARRASFVDDRDPEPVLIGIAEGKASEEEDRLLMAGLSASQFLSIFKNHDGDELRTIIQTAMRLAMQEGEKSELFRATLNQVLKEMADVSRLRGNALRSWGYPLPED